MVSALDSPCKVIMNRVVYIRLFLLTKRILTNNQPKQTLYEQTCLPAAFISSIFIRL